MSKIVITGGSGLLGKKMISLLQEENVNFISIKIRIESLKVDLLKIQEFSPDILFHFGALKKNANKNAISEKELYMSNVKLTKELYKYCEKNNIKLVYVSTADLYKRDGNPCSEFDNLSQSKSSITGGYYGWTKYLGDDFLKIQKGNFLIFRSSTIYDNINPENFSCARLIKNKNDIKHFIFDKKIYQMNFVRSDYFVRAIFNISNKKKTMSKVYNYTSSFWFNNFDILNLYSQKFGLKYLPSEEKVLEKRFNASNYLIKKELGIEFEESNYLQDLDFYLASKNIGTN